MSSQIPYAPEKEIKLKPTCFVCTHFRHRHEREENPLIFSNTNYCAKTGNEESAPALNKDECFKEKDCCLYDMHKVAVYDNDFHSVETEEEMINLFNRKYSMPG